MQKEFITRLAKELRKSEVKKLLKTHHTKIGEEDRERVEHSAYALLEHLLIQELKKGQVQIGTNMCI